MATAVIGLGNIGGTVAKNLADGGEHVIVADRTTAKSETFAANLGSNAKSASIKEAIVESDVVIFGVYFDVIKQLLVEYAEELKGKIIVDPSNPIAPDGNGGFKKTIPDDQSSGSLLSVLLPEGAKIVKAFGSLGAASLRDGSRRTPPAVLFYAADDAEAGRAVEKLISSSGFSPVKVGGIDQSIRMEVFGDLHEFGALGKLVSVEEAQSKI
jgi:predicted dinucleotide-binding enzyme